MSNSIQVIRKSEQTTSEWSGGLTTQLAIEPPEADYAERDFQWRISSAVVELDESVFTPLPGVVRLIMVLDGEMTLEHEGHHRVHLKPYEQDRFDGGWSTRSFGKVRDFNLMMKDGCEGSLEAVTVEAKGQCLIDSSPAAPGHRLTEAFYCVDAAVAFTADGVEMIELKEGDMLLFGREGGEAVERLVISNHAGTEAHMIRASVSAVCK